MNETHKKIKELLEQGLSQEQIAKQIGCSPATVCNIKSRCNKDRLPDDLAHIQRLLNKHGAEESMAILDDAEIILNRFTKDQTKKLIEVFRGVKQCI